MKENNMYVRLPVTLSSLLLYINEGEHKGKYSSTKEKKKKQKKLHSIPKEERDGDVRNICDGGSVEGIGGETLQAMEEWEPPLPWRRWPPHSRCHRPRWWMGLSWIHQDLGLHMRYVKLHLLLKYTLSMSDRVSIKFMLKRLYYNKITVKIYVFVEDLLHNTFYTQILIYFEHRNLLFRWIIHIYIWC